MTDTDYSNEVQDVVDALNAVYENKQANKKDSLSGDYSSDTESYPTCKAVKGAYGTKVTSWQSTPSDSNIPSEKLVKDTFDTLSSFKFIEIVTSKPTASADTMNKLYIVSENSKVNVYYTKSTSSGGSTTYSWVKLDSDILDEFSVAWTDITGRPTKTSDFTNDGEDGTNVYVANNDSRLSDARTPTSHTHGQITNDGKIGFAPISSVASNACIVITDTNANSMIRHATHLLSDHIKDSTAHSNIGSSANATQSTINTAINSALGGKASAGHHHGQLNNDGAITSTAVTVASEDNILITDASDSSKVKRVENLLAGHIIDSTAHTNIGSSANDTQATINSDIDTALGNKANMSNVINEVKVFAGQLAEAINPSS